MVIPSAAMPTVPLTVAVHALKKPCIYAGFNNLDTDGHVLYGNKISGRNWPMNWSGNLLSEEPATGFSGATWPSAKVTLAF